jgi:O-antigen ligase
MLAAIGTASAAALALALGLGFLPPIQDLLMSVSRSGDASEVLTLTGRTDLWSFVLGKVAERPLFGYGFNSAETVLSRDWYGNADAGYSAHNVLLQSLLTVGIVGTLPFALVYALLIHRWLTEQQQTLASYLTPYLMILGITEIHIASMPVLLSLVVFLAMASEACRRHRGPGVPSLVRAPPNPDAARAIPRAEPPVSGQTPRFDAGPNSPGGE